MKNLFAKRVMNTQKSFIREILKVTQNPDIISFAGGLPNPCAFPVAEITRLADKVLKEGGSEILQYTTTEGYYPLREFIARRYTERWGIEVLPEEILITNGSQQGLDLLGKVFLDSGDKVAIERPGYLGAIQAFSLYEPEFIQIPLEYDGIDINAFEKVLKNDNIKLCYCIPNFQNPSGVTYSLKKRIAMSFAIRNTNTVLIEDDAYGELRFSGADLPPIKALNNENSILLGSFSKIISPGLRVGWIYAEKEVIEKLVIAKQASDLHSNYLAQRIIYSYLEENDINQHIERIKQVYGRQRDLMVKLLEQYLPEEITFTKPEGGMFLWLTLPKELPVLEVFNRAMEERVAFVPGMPFYTDNKGDNTVRLNFSNSNEEKIEEGIKRLTKVLRTIMPKRRTK
ncbi:MAG: PLP-dependent aminotransferase family protein [Clostridia bacterium]|nr:PLP-dependent aminotransferase family protein [Clostridia bacterium]